MDSSILVILFSIFLLSFLYIFYTKRSHSDTSNKQEYPPGNTGWPFVGETLEYISTTRNGVPENFISSRCKKYATNIFRTSLFGQNMVMLCSPEGNKFVFSNENKLVQSWWLSSAEKIFPNPLNKTTSSISKRLRKISQVFLKPDALQKYVSAMDFMAKNHINTEWINCEQVEVLPLMRKYTFALACKLLFDIEDRELISKLETPFSSIAPGLFSIPVNLPGTKFNKAIKASKELRVEFESLIKQKRISLLENNKVGETTQDLLSVMVLDTDENGEFMTDGEISNQIVSLLMAAHGTATKTLVSTIKFLAELPEIYEQVFIEQMDILNSKGFNEELNWEDIKKMKYSWNVISEVLRLAPPIPGTFREVIKEFTYEGYLVPKGWKLHWNVYATHKSPEYFPNPEKFDPSRYEGNGPTPYAYIPFGGGARMCPGREYARLEILVFLHNLVTSLKWKIVFSKEKVGVDSSPVQSDGLLVQLYPHKA